MKSWIVFLSLALFALVHQTQGEARSIQELMHMNLSV